MTIDGSYIPSHSRAYIDFLKQLERDDEPAAEAAPCVPQIQKARPSEIAKAVREPNAEMDSYPISQAGLLRDRAPGAVLPARQAW